MPAKENQGELIMAYPPLRNFRPGPHKSGHQISDRLAQSFLKCAWVVANIKHTEPHFPFNHADMNFNSACLKLVTGLQGNDATNVSRPVSHVRKMFVSQGVRRRALLPQL